MNCFASYSQKERNNKNIVVNKKVKRRLRVINKGKIKSLKLCADGSVVEYQTTMWEVVGSNPGQTTTQGLKITEEKLLPL